MGILLLEKEQVDDVLSALICAEDDGQRLRLSPEGVFVADRELCEFL